MSYKVFNFVRLYIIILLISSSIFSQEEYIFNYNTPSIDINSTFESIDIKPYYKIFKSKLSIDDFKNNYSTLTEVSDTNLNYGYTTDVYYLYFRYQFKDNLNEKIYLKFNFPLLDSLKLTCYDSSNNQLVQYSGDHVSFEDKISIYRYPLFYLDNNYRECWIQIINQESMQLDSEIVREQSLMNDIINDKVFQGFYFGSIISLIIYNFVNYIFTKLRIYIIYALALSQYLLFIFLFNGFGSVFIWNKFSENFTDNSLIYSILSGVVFTIFYFINIIEVDKIPIKEFNIFKALISLNIFCLSLSVVFEYYIHIQITLIIMFFCIAYIYYICYKYYSKFEVLKLYIISWSIFISGAIILGLKGFGLLNSNIFIDHAFHIGLYLQQILLSILISQRIELNRNETDKNLLLIIENKNTLYETEKQRLIEITSLNQELEYTKERATNAYLELETSQKQLVQSDKMITLGSMVAGVAHEINTPLGAIIANTENILESMKGLIKKLDPKLNNITINDLDKSLEILNLSSDTKNILSSKEERILRKKIINLLERNNHINIENLSDYILELDLVNALEREEKIFNDPNIINYLEIASAIKGIIKKSNVIKFSAERVSKIVKSLKSFMHFEETEEKILSDIAEGMETVLIILHNKIKYGIEVIKNYRDVPHLYCFPDELNQVWTNLIHNAIQAMNENGKLQIDIEKSSIAIENIDIDKRNPEYKGEYISISIQDSGTGISPEVRPKIFQAFFTTKPAGEGSGLGLHIITNILEKHKGALILESEPGKTRFTVLLPIDLK